MPPGNPISSDSDLESVISYLDVVKPRRKSSGPKYSCSIEGCDQIFIRLDHLDKHEFYHNGIRKHACSYEGCNKSYMIVTHLKRHLRTTHERSEAPQQKNVPCAIDGCEKMFQSNCNMQRHIREVHENPKIYRCTHCGEKFTQKLKMRRHEITKHTGEYPYRCSKCSKGFYQQWQHERHVNNCKVYPCPNCASQFDKWTLYRKHCKETQHGRKCYKCEHCERVYAKPGELQKHIVVKHLDADDGQKMSFKCSVEGCERAYLYERNLKQHIRTAHTGQRFECKETACESAFSSAQNLAKHIEREHIKPKRDKTCGEGGKATVETKKLKRLRKKRKDAGQATVSNLVKLSGLAVDREVDKLLRMREETALTVVSAALSEEVDDTAEQLKETEEPVLEADSMMDSNKIQVDEVKEKMVKQLDSDDAVAHEMQIASNKEQEIETLMTIALQEI